jgi:hypothetical protein
VDVAEGENREKILDVRTFSQFGYFVHIKLFHITDREMGLPGKVFNGRVPIGARTVNGACTWQVEDTLSLLKGHW